MHVKDNWLACRRAEPVAHLGATTVLRSNGIRVVATDRIVTVEDVRILIACLAEFTGVTAGTPTVYDLRGLDFSNVRSGTVRQWLDVSAMYPALRRTPGAFVVGSSLGYGMMRMYQILSDVHGVAPEAHHYVTRSLIDAVNWTRARRDIRPELLGRRDSLAETCRGAAAAPRLV